MNCRLVHLRARGVRAAMFALHRGLDPRPTSLYRLTARCHWPYEPTGGEGTAWSSSWDFTLMPLQANLTLQPAPAKHQALSQTHALADLHACKPEIRTAGGSMGTNLISDVQTPTPGAAATTPNCELWSRRTVALNFWRAQRPVRIRGTLERPSSQTRAR